MAIYVGDTITDYISHVVNGAPVTGATFTVVSARDPNGTSFSPTITEIGGGVYRLTFAATLAGQWYLLVVDAAQTPDAYYESTWDVDAAPITTAAVATPASGTGTSLATLRRRMGAAAGELILCRTTAAGTTTTFSDYIRLALPDGTLRGRIAYVSGGTAANLYQQRRVVTNTQDDATVTLTPALPVATAYNDTIELYRMNDQGPVPDEYHAAINQAIEDIKEDVMIAQVGSTVTFDRTSPVITFPTTWVIGSGIDYQRSSGEWIRVPTKDFEIDRASRTIELRNRARDLAASRPIRLRGYASIGPLTVDTDETPVDAEWLIAQASYHLFWGVAMRMSEQHRDRWERRALDQAKIADMRRGYVASRPVGAIARLAAVS